MSVEDTRSRSSKGFSLILVLIISFILSSLITTYLYFSINQKNRLIRRSNREQAFYIVCSGIARITRNLPIFVLKRSESILGGQFNSKIEVNRGFIDIDASGTFKKERVSINAEYGMKIDSTMNNTAVILSTNDSPEINGWVKGKIITGLDLPPLNKTYINNTINSFYTSLQSPYQADTELFSPQVFSKRRELPKKEKIFVNDAIFLKDDTFDYPVTLISTSDIIIESGCLNNLTLIAFGDIRIQRYARLNNVSLFSASNVVLSGYSYFSGEIISENEIRVGEFSTIGESSVLVTKGENTNIRFTELSTFSGTAISIDEAKVGSGYSNIIDIGKDTKCRGLIYSTGRVSIKGEMKGLVCAFSFYDKKIEGFFGNAINGNISSKIPDNIVLSAYLNTNKVKRKSWKFIENVDLHY